MDREYMKSYFKAHYEDPYHAATAADEEYDLEMQKFNVLEEELCKLAGGMDSKLWQKHEDCVDQLLNASEILARDTYLMGAEDREKMLR